jgi:hypothetical protein
VRVKYQVPIVEPIKLVGLHFLAVESVAFRICCAIPFQYFSGLARKTREEIPALTLEVFVVGLRCPFWQIVHFAAFLHEVL